MWFTYIRLQILLFYLCLNSFTIDAASLRCYEGSFDTFSVFSLDDPTPLLNSSCYDPTRRTVFYTFGFYGEASEESAKAIVEAYLTSFVNIVLLNWEKEASGGIFGSYVGYLVALRNAVDVGRQLAQALVKLFAAGLNIITTELIGFSLGAQLMGITAREFQKTGQNITRVVGLDPAGPLYDGIISFRGLDEASATFVLIVHTNPGGLGSDECTGTVDTWPNCGSSVQPGCVNATGNGDGRIFSTENSCSHGRSWKYFAEAIRNPRSFIARSASSCGAWNDQGETICLGDQIPLSLRGNFYLNTNPAPFYGRGEAGSVPESFSANSSFTSPDS